MLDRTKALPREFDPAAVPFSTRPLSPAVGVEIMGIDCAGDIDGETFRRIESIWHDNCVVLFRNQSLDEEQEWRFASRFGQTGRVHHQHKGGSKYPGVMYISNVRENGELIGALPDGEMYFHHDQCYIEKPAIATMLYALEIPSHGGNTLFANMFAVFEALPHTQRELLRKSTAMHVYDYAGHPTKRGATIGEGTPHFAHPMVLKHPGNGREALYVNRLMTDHIVGLDRKISERVLEGLFDIAEQKQFIYEHVWQPGDLLLWDNRSCAHARTDFSAAERRLMRRVAIVG